MTQKRDALHEVLPFIAGIGDPDLLALVERVWLRLWRESGHARLADAPWFTVVREERDGATSLVEHICQVAEAAAALSEVATRQGSRPDRDLVLAGAALIDVDKLVMLDSRTLAPSDSARFSQHTFYGAHVAFAEGAPWELVHLILSHSKNTGVRPRTLEAVILHYADYAVFDLRNIHEGRDELAAEAKPKWAR